MKKALLCANWKMNKDPETVRDYLRWILRMTDLEAQQYFIFFVPALTAFVCREELAKSPAKWGGQNCYFKDQGAFTGENSPQVLRAMGATYCLVGHSERRHLFGEDDKMVLLKMRALWRLGIQPMLCVGETREEKEKGQSLDVVKRQLSRVLKEVSEFGEHGLQDEDTFSSKEGDSNILQSDSNNVDVINEELVSPVKNLVQKLRHAFCRRADLQLPRGQSRTRFEQDFSLEKHSHNLQSSDMRAAESRRYHPPLGGVAYEPVWAIGTGISADSDHIRFMCDEIRRLFMEVKQSVTVLYGGSVDESNIARIYSSSGVDGFLVGGASLKPDRFFQLYKALQK